MELDQHEVVPEAMSDEAFSAYRAGVEAGYAQAMTSLDDAGAALAELRPSRGVDAAAARSRRGTYSKPPQSAEQIRAAAYASWGLEDPRAPLKVAEPEQPEQTEQPKVPTPRATEPIARDRSLLIVDLNPGDPKSLRWAAGKYSQHAAQLRAAGDVAGAVEAQVHAEKLRMDAASLTASRTTHTASVAARRAGDAHAEAMVVADLDTCEHASG